MGTLTWLGDSDPEAQAITQDGVLFVKGVKTTVKDKDVFERLSNNPTFTADADAEPNVASEPDEDEQERRADEGTEKGALKAQLKRDYGVTMPGNPSVDTLRKRLADEAGKRA